MNVETDCQPSTTAIEELRIIATVLLVLYHVVGPPGNGLDITDPTPLRLTVDLLGDFRMPAFGLIAGFVYALRPPTPKTMNAFLRGKVRRLVLPGAIAALLFVVVSNAFQTSSALPWSQIWGPLILPYAHFWFLQSILVLFVIVGTADMLTRCHGEAGLLVVALILYFLPLPLIEIFSISRALSLAPFFVAGICIQRHQNWIALHSTAITVASLAMIASWAAFTLAGWAAASGSTTTWKGQEFLLTIPLALIVMLRAPHHPDIRTISQFSFTIYLYHIFGTATARMALTAMEVSDLTTHIVFGVGAGLAFPILLHMMLARRPLGARLILGLRQRRSKEVVIRGRHARQERKLPA